MTTVKNAAHRHARARHGGKSIKPAHKPMSDRSVYLGLAIVGLFVVIIGWLLSEGVYWRQTLFGFLMLTLLNINFAGWDAYRGKRLSDWKQPLAKIPLRFVGFGRADGKPIEAAHHQPATRRAMILFGLVSLALSLGLAVLLLWPW